MQGEFAGMTFSALIDPGVENYFERFRIDRDTLLYFVHIPKTAGTSFGQELRRRLQPNLRLSLDYGPDAKPMHEQRSLVVDEFLGQADRDDIRFASGHIPFRYCRKIAKERPNTHFVTFLRDPIDRIVSDYRYQTTTAHPLRDQFIARYATLDDYVMANNGSDKMYKFLCTYASEPVCDVIERISNQFLFVGTLNNYELSFEVITSIVGEASSPELKANLTNRDEAPKIELNSEQIRAIGMNNERDLSIFKHFDDLWQANSELITQKLEIGAPVSSETAA